MPNHITTQVEISGTKEQIDTLVERTGLIRDNGADENKFDFNGIIRMPAELNIQAGSTASLGLMAYSEEHYENDARPKTDWWKEKYPGVNDYLDLYEFLDDDESDEAKEALRLGKQAFDNVQKYGHPDWYEWSIANWGTKWNAYDVRYLEGDDTRIVIEIQTAWDTPEGIWKRLINEDYEVNGVIYGEMDGYEYIGDGGEVFDVYQNIEVEYRG